MGDSEERRSAGQNTQQEKQEGGMNDEAETYSVAEIQAAYEKHARPDDWGVPSFYFGSLINALRGEYDD